LSFFEFNLIIYPGYQVVKFDYIQSKNGEFKFCILSGIATIIIAGERTIIIKIKKDVFRIA